MHYNIFYIANSFTINTEIVTIQASYTGNRRDNYTIHAMWKNYRNIKDGNLAIRPNNRHKDFENITKQEVNEFLLAVQ